MCEVVVSLFLPSMRTADRIVIETRNKIQSAKSFYGKAYWRDADGDRVLYSYGTEVARITASGAVQIENLYSVTTTRHIREFLLQNGFPAGSARQIRDRYIGK